MAHYRLLALFFSVFSVIVLFPSPDYGEVKTDVLMRFSRHEGFSRIVFETADESFIKNTRVENIHNLLKVQFPNDINLRTQKAPDFESSLKGKNMTVTLPQPFTMKVLRLTSPPRLSIDLFGEDKGTKPIKTDDAGMPLPAGFRVSIDPGHGGYELGIISGDLREKDITLSIARAIETTLNRKNRAVFLTRKADQYLSITDRALSVNQKSPDVFITIHLSSSDEFVIYTALLESTGAETQAQEPFTLRSRQKRYVEKSKALGEGLGKAIKDEFKKDIIFRRMDLPLLTSVGTASVMIEIPKSMMYDQALKTRLSDTILKGIAAYAGQ